MNQVHQMKGSFDNGKTWYQLEWLDVEFRHFEEATKECNSIEELNSKILELFPECQLKYEYIGERKMRTASPKVIKRIKKKK